MARSRPIGSGTDYHSGGGRGNPYHRPGGDPQGGEFTSADIAGATTTNTSHGDKVEGDADRADARAALAKNTVYGTSHADDKKRFGGDTSRVQNPDSSFTTRVDESGITRYNHPGLSRAIAERQFKRKSRSGGSFRLSPPPPNLK